MSKIVSTEKAPAAIGPYSQGVVANGFVFASGQVPLDPVTGQVKGDTIEQQATQSLENLTAVLAAAGSDNRRVVKTTCFLADMGDFPVFNKIYETYFPDCPARSCVAVKALPKGVLVEVEAIAEVG